MTYSLVVRLSVSYAIASRWRVPRSLLSTATTRTSRLARGVFCTEEAGYVIDKSGPRRDKLNAEVIRPITTHEIMKSHKKRRLYNLQYHVVGPLRVNSLDSPVRDGTRLTVKSVFCLRRWCLLIVYASRPRWTITRERVAVTSRRGRHVSMDSATYSTCWYWILLLLRLGSDSKFNRYYYAVRICGAEIK